MLIEELSGTQVIIIDDIDREVESLIETLKKREINTEYIKIDLAGEMPQHKIIDSVKLVFLDLHYGPSFDPAFCSELISEVVPRGHQYYLVVWTKDPDKTEAVIEELQSIDLAPISYLSKLKENFRTGDSKYDIDKLLQELDNDFEKITEVHEFYGRIEEIDKDQVLINCLLYPEEPVYQIRRFDKSPFENYINLVPGNLVIIRSVTKPGSRLFEFRNGNTEIAKYFPKKKDFFKDIDITKLFDKE